MCAHLACLVIARGLHGGLAAHNDGLESLGVLRAVGRCEGWVVDMVCDLGSNGHAVHETVRACSGVGCLLAAAHRHAHCGVERDDIGLAADWAIHLRRQETGWVSHSRQRAPTRNPRRARNRSRPTSLNPRRPRFCTSAPSHVH